MISRAPPIDRLKELGYAELGGIDTIRALKASKCVAYDLEVKYEMFVKNVGESVSHEQSTSFESRHVADEATHIISQGKYTAEVPHMWILKNAHSNADKLTQWADPFIFLDYQKTLFNDLTRKILQGTNKMNFESQATTEARLA